MRRGGGEGDGRKHLRGFSAGSSRQLPGGEGAEGPSSYQGAWGHAASVTAPRVHRPQQEASLRALPLCCDCGQGPAHPGPLHPGAAHLPSHGALAHKGPRGCTDRGCPPTPRPAASSLGEAPTPYACSLQPRGGPNLLRPAASGLGEPLASVRPHPLQLQGAPTLGEPPPPAASGSPHPLQPPGAPAATSIPPHRFCLQSTHFLPQKDACFPRRVYK